MPSAAPTFSAAPSGFHDIRTDTRVDSCPSGWNVTMPAMPLSIARHAMRSSGCCSVIAASHSSWTPSIDLFDAIDVVHESRELFELRPLVVRGTHRHRDVNALHHIAHVGPSHRGHDRGATLTGSRVSWVSCAPCQ